MSFSWSAACATAEARRRRSSCPARSMSTGRNRTRPGTPVEDEAVVELRGNPCPYVSRGGLKLEKALRDFGVDPTGFVCSDSGASTGGFTDCLLQKGAKKVFAIDVGYGQLAWSIRQDPRVVCMERTNIRYVTPEQLGEPLDLSVVDVSFISLRIVLPAIRALLKPTGRSSASSSRSSRPAGRRSARRASSATRPSMRRFCRIFWRWLRSWS